MNIAQQLNSFLQQERYLDFQDLLEKSYQSQSITEDVYYKFQGFKNFNPFCSSLVENDKIGLLLSSKLY